MNIIQDHPLSVQRPDGSTVTLIFQFNAARRRAVVRQIPYYQAIKLALGPDVLGIDFDKQIENLDANTAFNAERIHAANCWNLINSLSQICAFAERFPSDFMPIPATSDAKGILALWNALLADDALWDALDKIVHGLQEPAAETPEKKAN